MAVRDIREDPAEQTAFAMGIGGQSEMGESFKSLDKGRPGQERVRKGKKTAGNGSVDAKDSTNSNISSPLLTELVKFFKKKKKKKNLDALSTPRGRTGMGY